MQRHSDLGENDEVASAQLELPPAAAAAAACRIPSSEIVF